MPDRVAWFMGKLLEKIRSPRDLRQLSRPELDSLCEEMREVIIQTVSDNGGHLASNLGVVELTVALGLVFSPPEDALVWDVGHQSYPYKLLTGRYNEFSTLRREGGISGFPNRDESPCDSFTSGHSSASISSALGLSEACRLQSKDGYVVAVIGDGALTGGLSFEGLNNAGQHRRNLIVILNDNTMSISKNVGSLARYLTYMRTKPGYIKAKSSVEDALGHLPLVGKPIARLMRRVKSNIKKILYNSTIFSDLGFAYYGPFDGHNIKELSETFEAAKLVRKPVLIHVRTYKGKGYQYAEQSPTLYHGISSFDVDTGDPGEKAQSFSDVFGQTLCQLAREDNRICAITAAMAEGTGLAGFRQQFKGRFYDVGIAEEHAVTFSGGLAVGGMLPVFAVYSTFLQRSYDQLIHDVAMQKIKILLAIDRAGIVGEDGMTHQGLFDVAFLRTVPGVTLYSPTYFQELREQLAHLAKDGSGICAVRYPRGRELYKPSYFHSGIEPFSVYGPPEAETCIVIYGRLFSFAAEAADKLKIRGTDVKLLKLNRVIPIERAAARKVISCRQVFFFEEGIRQGGAGEHFASLLLEEGFAGKYVLRAIDKPFVKHAPMFRALETLGLNAGGIMKTVLEHFREEEDRLAEKEA